MIDPPRDDHATTVYAHFGLAVHRAQSLEHALVKTLVLDRLPERSRLTPAEIEAVMRRQYDGTLGNLVRELDDCPRVPDDLRDLLQRALALRNWLVHDYLREHTEELSTAEGCEVLVQELEATAELFEQALCRVGEVFELCSSPALPIAEQVRPVVADRPLGEG